MTGRPRWPRGWLPAALCCLLGAMSLPAAAQGTAAAAMDDTLRLALQEKDPARARALLAAGANVKARDGLGGTALHVAANFVGDLDVIRQILARGGEVNAVNDDGETALLSALRHGHYRSEDPARLLAVATLLLARGATVKDPAGQAGLHLRAAMDPPHLSLARLLIRHGATMPADALDTAMAGDQVETVKLLLEHATPAMLAFKGPEGASALHRAAESPSLLFAMRWLVQRGADIHATDERGVTALGRAAFHDNLPAMAYLHGLKAGLHTRDSEGQTPLHLAAYGARHDVLRWLIQRGGDITARDAAGLQALDIAIDTHRFAFYSEAQKLALITLLGGTPRDLARGRFSDHPLHAAVARLDFAAVEGLLQAGADANAKDASGHTALFWAITWAARAVSTPREQAFGNRLLPLLIRHGAATCMTMGNEATTYEDHARALRFGEALERVRQRHAPAATPERRAQRGAATGTPCR